MKNLKLSKIIPLFSALFLLSVTIFAQVVLKFFEKGN